MTVPNPQPPTPEQTPQPGNVVLRREWAADLTAATLYALLTLRVEVFVVEQRAAYPELDGRDLLGDTRHFWVAAGGRRGEPVAYVRLLVEGDGFRLGRMCVAKRFRGTGLGRRLVEAAMAEVADASCVLDAQLTAEGLYAAFGFRRDGAEYTDDDGIPHVPMRRPAR